MLLNASAQFKLGLVRAIEPSFDAQQLYIGGTNDSIFAFNLDHRVVTDKLTVTKNRDFVFSDEKLNSKRIINGIDIQVL